MPSVRAVVDDVIVQFKNQRTITSYYPDARKRSSDHEITEKNAVKHAFDTLAGMTPEERATIFLQHAREQPLLPQNIRENLMGEGRIPFCEQAEIYWNERLARVRGKPSG